MEICRLPIHIRFIFCNLNEASVRALANSLLTNSSLIGFTCMFHPCMVEERSNGGSYHAPTSSAAQCVRDAVIRTRAPLEIWNNWKLEDDVIAERQRFAISLPASHLHSTSVSVANAKSATYDFVRQTTLSLEDQEDCARKLE